MDTSPPLPCTHTHTHTHPLPSPHHWPHQLQLSLPFLFCISHIDLPTDLQTLQGGSCLALLHLFFCLPRTFLTAGQLHDSPPSSSRTLCSHAHMPIFQRGCLRPLLLFHFVFLHNAYHQSTYRTPDCISLLQCKLLWADIWSVFLTAVSPRCNYGLRGKVLICTH